MATASPVRSETPDFTLTMSAIEACRLLGILSMFEGQDPFYVPLSNELDVEGIQYTESAEFLAARREAGVDE